MIYSDSWILLIVCSQEKRIDTAFPVITHKNIWKDVSIILKMKELNLVMAVNQQYLPICETMLFSFFRYHKEYHVTLYLLNRVLNDKEIYRLEEFLKSFKAELFVISVDKEYFAEMPTVSNRFSEEIYYRILAHELIPRTVRKALWIDADIICMGSISELYEMDLKGNLMAVGRDFACESSAISKIKKSMGIMPEHAYFNSGVLLMDLEKIRREFTRDIIVELMNRYSNVLIYPDQDILNRMYQGKVTYFDEKVYNYQVNSTWDLKGSVGEIKLLHYTGYRKPWIPKYARPVCRYYWQVCLQQKKYFACAKFTVLYLLWGLPKRVNRMKEQFGDKK